MDWQSLFNIAIMLIGVLGGWLYSSLRGELKSLKEDGRGYSDKIQHQEVSMAKDYALKDDLEKLTKAYKEDLDKLMQAMFVKLDRIENKLDNKVDKS